MNCTTGGEMFFFLFSHPSDDTGGGLVVVCMTSFTSMLGVTSYVRLLNCYMGQHSLQFLYFKGFCLVHAFIQQAGMIFWYHECSFLQRAKGRRFSSQL